MQEHYYTEKPKSKLVLFKISAILRNKRFEFFSATGLFSQKKVDLGTELLINDCEIKNNWDVLDLGCGYGAVGISMKKLFPTINIFMTDINQRAVKISKKNAELNNVNVEIMHGNLFEAFENKKFNTILINPPQTAGKDICFRMIELSKDFLKEDGLLQLVARHNKGGSSFENKMQQVFNNVTTISKKSGYRIYVSYKKNN